MAISSNNQIDIQFVVSQMVQLTGILIADAKNTPSEFEATTITDINKNIQDFSDYLETLIPPAVLT